MRSTTIAVDLTKVRVRGGDLAPCGSGGPAPSALAGSVLALPGQTVVMEACGTAHYWGRAAESHGHRVVLLPPHAVRPYVARNKTDAADAKGLLEAVRNEDVCPVPLKSVDQHTLASLHRLRSAWQATRTARLNTLRGLLRELGFSIPAGARQVVPHVLALVSDAESGLPDRSSRRPWERSASSSGGCARLNARSKPSPRRPP